MLLSYCFASVTPAALFYLVYSRVVSGFVVSIPRGVTAMTTKLRAADTTTAAAPATAAAVSVRPEILPANAPLPFIDDGITVVSFNVLLPNGNDGWWIYKVRGAMSSTSMTFLGHVYVGWQRDRGTVMFFRSFVVLIHI